MNNPDRRLEIFGLLQIANAIRIQCDLERDRHHALRQLGARRLSRCNELIATGLTMRLFIDTLSPRARVTIAIIVVVIAVIIIAWV
jgi:hypothetical protein